MARRVRACWRAGARGWGAGALLACCAALWVPLPREAQLAAELPQHGAAAVAHFLADFTNHRDLYTHISGAWWVEQEAGNGTAWSYTVRYACGARCSGRAAVLHERAPHAPHRLLLSDARCSAPPLLPWPQLCEYTEVESWVSERAGGGARLREAARAWCPLLALAWGSGACRPAAARARHLHALRLALASRAP